MEAKEENTKMRQVTSRSGRPAVSPVQRTGRPGKGTGYPVTQANTKSAGYVWHSDNCQQQTWDTWPEPYTSHEAFTERRIFSRGKLHPLHRHLINKPFLSWSYVKYLFQPTYLTSMWLHIGELLANFLLNWSRDKCVKRQVGIQLYQPRSAQILTCSSQ